MPELKEDCYVISDWIMPAFVTDRRGRYYRSRKSRKELNKKKSLLFHMPKKDNMTYTIATNGKKIKVGTSKSEVEWLNKLCVPERQKVIVIHGKLFSLDGYDPRTMTAYEFCGEIYHSIRAYPREKWDVATWMGKTPRQLYYQTIERYNLLNMMGIKVFFVWYKEYKKGFMGRYYRGKGDDLY